jgi:hypothetical protein
LEPDFEGYVGLVALTGIVAWETAFYVDVSIDLAHYRTVSRTVGEVGAKSHSLGYNA